MPARGHRRRAILVVTLGVALHLPTLDMGFFTDDYTHQIILQGIGEHRDLRPWSLYDFGDFPDPEEPSWQLGGYPWWTPPDWKVRFFRPLTSLTLWLDHLLFGEWATGYHLTSLAWYAGLLTLVYWLYHFLELPPNTCLLALLLFTLADSGLFPVAWPANRNSLIAVFFTVASVAVLSRHRVWGRAPALLGALALATSACLGKETGVTAFALIAVYLLWLRRRTEVHQARRWATVGTMVSLVVAGLYLVLLVSQDYGANCMFYAMPWNDPSGYLIQIGTLLSMGGLSLVGPLSIELVHFVPHGVPLAVTLFLVVVVPFAWFLWGRVKRHPAAGFLAAWTVVAVLAQGAAPPSDRLLFAAAVGSSGLLALFVSATLFGKGSRPRPRLSRALGLLILVTAGALSGVSLLVQGFLFSRLAGEVRQAILAADVGPTTLGRREVFVLQSPNTLVPLAMLATWTIETDDWGVRFWPMQTGRRGLRWTRVDERTFELESLDRPFLTDPLERVFLTRRGRPVPGARRETPLFTVEAFDVDQAGLRRFRVRCADSLDTAGYRFLTVRDGRLVATSPPAVGESVRINAVVPPHPFVP